MAGWKKTETGYALETRRGTAYLVKEARWVLVLGDVRRELGKRASFDEAEGLLRELGAL